MAINQSGHRNAHCHIIIAGQDVTDKMNPYLISVRVISKKFDEASIELDDRNAELAIPQDGALVQIEIGWDGSQPVVFPQGNPFGSERQLAFEAEAPYVFTGYVDSVESGFARRGGGRRMWIDAKDRPTKGKMKSYMQNSMGEGSADDSDSSGGKQIPLQDMWSKVTKDGGYTGLLTQGMQGFKRPNWNQAESMQAWGERIAGELGGQLKLTKDMAILVHNDDYLYGQVEAVWGVNLISWRIKPFSGRPQWAGGGADFFKAAEGAWGQVNKAFGGDTPFGMATAMMQVPGSAMNAQVGDQFNAGTGADSERGRGGGWLIMNGEPAARALGSVSIIGARPGVDGVYKIAEAEHNYSRRGYTTRLDLTNPKLNTRPYLDSGWPKSPSMMEPTEPVPFAGAGGLPRTQTPTTPTPDASVDIGDVEIQ